MIDDGLWPSNQKEWDRYAADLNARMAVFQVHVEPRWLYALCTVCGWDLEQDPLFSLTSDFRFTVANHHCPEILEVFEPLPVVRSLSQLELF